MNVYECYVKNWTWRDAVYNHWGEYLGLDLPDFAEYIGWPVDKKRKHLFMDCV